MLGDIQVSENIATACLIASLNKRIVLISSKEPRLAEHQTVATLERLLNKPCVTIFGSAEITWPRLAADLGHSQNCSIILKNLDQFSVSVQTHLLDALFRPPPSPVSLEDTVIVALGSYDRITRPMRQAILYCEHVESVSETRMLALPAQVGFQDHMAGMRERLPLVTIIPEVNRYMQDILVFIRTSRLVRRGVSPRVTRDLELLVRSLCVLRDLEFATPSIVSAAARKMLPMKLELCSPEKEPSLQWGGDQDVARIWISNWNNDLVVESILETVPPPL